jgi:hypothetical protein
LSSTPRSGTPSKVMRIVSTSGVRCFLAGESDGQTRGYVRLLFSKRCSAGGYEILRLDPIRGEDLARIKRKRTLDSNAQVNVRPSRQRRDIIDF